MKKVMNQKGFTLVELMVVVAIIGILSAIAVPNFKKYQAKSKQTEAKLQLSAVYSVEVSAQADYDSFASCLTDLGYDVAPKGFYIIGFQTAHVSVTGVTSRSGACNTTTSFAPTAHQKANTTATLPSQSDLDSDTPDSDSFKAGATGNISSSTTGYDKWTIDHAKDLRNSTSGI